MEGILVHRSTTATVKQPTLPDIFVKNTTGPYRRLYLQRSYRDDWSIHMWEVLQEHGLNGALYPRATPGAVFYVIKTLLPKPVTAEAIHALLEKLCTFPGDRLQDEAVACLQATLEDFQHVVGTFHQHPFKEAATTPVLAKPHQVVASDAHQIDRFTGPLAAHDLVQYGNHAPSIDGIAYSKYSRLTNALMAQVTGLEEPVSWGIILRIILAQHETVGAIHRFLVKVCGNLPATERDDDNFERLIIDRLAYNGWVAWLRDWQPVVRPLRDDLIPSRLPRSQDMDDATLMQKLYRKYY